MEWLMTATDAEIIVAILALAGTIFGIGRGIAVVFERLSNHETRLASTEGELNETVDLLRQTGLIVARLEERTSK